jgi:hypothetical protein
MATIIIHQNENNKVLKLDFEKTIDFFNGLKNNIQENVKRHTEIFKVVGLDYQIFNNIILFCCKDLFMYDKINNVFLDLVDKNNGIYNYGKNRDDNEYFHPDVFYWRMSFIFDDTNDLNKFIYHFNNIDYRQFEENLIKYDESIYILK